MTEKAIANFPERLAKRRQRVGLTQEQVAIVTGLKPSAISHFEGGRRRPSLANLRKLCIALMCSSDELLGL